MSLCVTGHRGFIGGHLTKLLDERKIRWVGYDLVEGNDIRDECGLDAFFEKNQVSEVIHLAALAGVRRGEEYPNYYLSTNVVGTMNVVHLCEKYNVKHLVNFSSSSVYGDSKPPVSESFVKHPISFYGITKLGAELIANNSSIPQVTTVVPFTVYGESGRRDAVIYRWLEQIKNNQSITLYGDGLSERGYVNVHDLVEATVKIVHEFTGHWSRESFNLGGAEVIRLKDLVELFKEVFVDLNFIELPAIKADIKSNWADIGKAGKILSFYPEKKFVKNVRKILKQVKKEMSL